MQALGPESKSLVATPDQVKTLVEQAKGIDPGRVFRVCDQIAEMEDKLRYVLSVRTLIEMSLIRASRLATTATVEELLRVVKALKEGGAGSCPLPEVRQPATDKMPVAPVPPLPKPDFSSRKDILDDPKLNAILEAIPGATVADIKDRRR